MDKGSFTVVCSSNKVNDADDFLEFVDKKGGPVTDQAKESRVVAKCRLFLGTRDGARARLAGS